MNILAVGAHPDDIEVGCGGTLIKYADRGHDVFLLIMTRGERGGEGEIREKEQMDAAGLMGIKDVFWGGFEDTELLNQGNAIIHTVEGCLESTRPDFIFVNYYDDTHQDHRTVNEAVLSATRYVRNVLFYEVPTTDKFVPQVYVNIGETLEKKLEALKAHRSQIMKTNIEDLSIIELARSSANFRGIQGRVKYAEAFRALRLFINI